MTVQPLYDEEPGRSAASSGMGGVALSNDIVIPYFTDLTNTEQKQRRLPGIAAGEQITAIAMTEPGTGSDLSRIRARTRAGDHYVVNGAKTFTSNGQNADLVATAFGTSDHPRRGISLLCHRAGDGGGSSALLGRRAAIGTPIGSFPNSRFAEEAAMAKWWATELQNRIVGRGLGL